MNNRVNIARLSSSSHILFSFYPSFICIESSCPLLLVTSVSRLRTSHLRASQAILHRYLSRNMKTDRIGYQQNAMGACEWMVKESVVCPKPRRFSFIRCPINRSAEMGDAGAASELLEIIVPEVGYDFERTSPFLLGSPPSRASNPLVQDARFADKRLVPLSPSAPLSPTSHNGGGCARTKFGHEPAPVRIEGFNCSISAVA
ncbi:hypothetical protein SAY87_021375 [Trapa incisa]|uniref:Uncharacterized protein n=1 Tax=Trapa incisa TaxID=236973 RepID=A0AAN7JT89_9MYRT|nr:hypothetical protein SAY87_021375 [Trapa incisa]